jgi:hypothetical protein
MALHIPDIRAIRLFVPFVISYADFITNFTNGRMTRILTGYFLASPESVEAGCRTPDIKGNIMGLKLQNE